MLPGGRKQPIDTSYIPRLHPPLKMLKQVRGKGACANLEPPLRSICLSSLPGQQTVPQDEGDLFKKGKELIKTRNILEIIMLSWKATMGGSDISKHPKSPEHPCPHTQWGSTQCREGPPPPIHPCLHMAEPCPSEGTADKHCVTQEEHPRPS